MWPAPPMAPSLAVAIKGGIDPSPDPAVAGMGTGLRRDDGSGGVNWA